MKPVEFKIVEQPRFTALELSEAPVTPPEEFGLALTLKEISYKGVHVVIEPRNYEIVIDRVKGTVDYINLKDSEYCYLVMGSERHPFKRFDGITVGNVSLTPGTLQVVYDVSYPSHRRVGCEEPKEKVIPFWQQKQEQHKFRTKRKH